MVFILNRCSKHVFETAENVFSTLSEELILETKMTYCNSMFSTQVPVLWSSQHELGMQKDLDYLD